MRHCQLPRKAFVGLAHLERAKLFRLLLVYGLLEDILDLFLRGFGLYGRFHLGCQLAADDVL